MVASTTAAGTISQTARGFSSFFTKSASEEAPTAFSLASSSTAFGDLSKTTHWWPPLSSRRTMLAPIRPSPIIPSCIADSFEPDRGRFGRSPWFTAVRSRFIAAPTPSVSPKIDEPATSTLAPASNDQRRGRRVDAAVHLHLASRA